MEYEDLWSILKQDNSIQNWWDALKNEQKLIWAHRNISPSETHDARGIPHKTGTAPQVRLKNHFFQQVNGTMVSVFSPVHFCISAWKTECTLISMNCDSLGLQLSSGHFPIMQRMYQWTVCPFLQVFTIKWHVIKNYKTPRFLF